MARETILIVNRRQNLLEELRDVLTEQGHSVLTAADIETGRRIVEDSRVDIVICDSGTLGKNAGEFLEWINRNDPQGVTVVLSSWADWETALTGLRRAIHFAADETHEAPTRSRESRRIRDLEASYPGISKLEFNPKGFLLLRKPASKTSSGT